MGNGNAIGCRFTPASANSQSVGPSWDRPNTARRHRNQKVRSKKRHWPPRLLELRQDIAALKRVESERSA